VSDVGELRALAAAAQTAGRILAGTTGGARRAALRAIAGELRAAETEILAANSDDCRRAERAGLPAPKLDRLRLDSARIEAMAEAVREVAALPDPVGQTVWGGVRPNGLSVAKVRVPLGVVLFVYESRPNVTADAAALCLMSGNAAILRGGSDAASSNRALGAAISRALAKTGLPPACIAVVPTADRAAVDALLAMPEYIDLAIPRGGSELIARVRAHARMPVLAHDRGVCHIFVDASARAADAERIVVNAKCQRPGVCNAAECLLVHEDAVRVLPAVGAALQAKGVEIRGCPRACQVLPFAVPAKPEDFGCEFLDLVLAVKVVPSLDAAVQHIAEFGSGHTEAIVTNDQAAARRFAASVDASAVMVNASTRFNDGGELGLGAEIGIATGKFHARGPCGLAELTTTKYIVVGDGHVRE
jgi:glutamate-5-semialdehyde dehydrogenase